MGRPAGKADNQTRQAKNIVTTDKNNDTQQNETGGTKTVGKQTYYG